MGVLGGFVRPDSGSVSVDGVPLSLGNPHASARAGFALVHQHFMLVPAFTVEENLSLSASESGFIIRPAELAAKALSLGRDLGWELNPKASTRNLGVGIQQRIEILKALATEAPILIFDEPTAVLQGDEVDELFRVLRRLRAEGRTILLIAHKLAEVLAVADRITVLRAGQWVATADRREADTEKLATWMLGARPPIPESVPTEAGEIVLHATGIVALGGRGERKIDGIDLEVRQGEIVGIGGVDGNGQVELAEVLARVLHPSSGTIRCEGTVGYIPQDRHRHGLALEMTIEENLLVEGHRHDSLRHGPLLRSGAIRTWSESLRKRFEVAAPNVTLPAKSLSGGNQQKVVVARTFDAKPDVLVAVNPTRGLDLRAAAFVRHQLIEAARGGAGIVLISTDLEELDEVATRRLYLESGRLVERFLGANR